MQADQARRILGVDAGADREAIRVAFRTQLLRTHPDLNAAPDATDRTIRLTQAYAALVGADPGAATAVDGEPGPPERSEPPAPAPPIASLTDDDDTITVAAPADEVLMLLLDVAHDLGEISYLDPTAGLVEVIVEFVEAPTSSVLMSLQGRATGVTEVFCTVEPLSGGESPPAAAVTRLVHRMLNERNAPT